MAIPILHAMHHLIALVEHFRASLSAIQTCTEMLLDLLQSSYFMSFALTATALLSRLFVIQKHWLQLMTTMLNEWAALPVHHWWLGKSENKLAFEEQYRDAVSF